MHLRLLTVLSYPGLGVGPTGRVWRWGFAALIFCWLVAGAAGGASTAAAEVKPVVWDVQSLGRAPRMFPAPGIKREGVRSFFYAGPKYRGKPTRVFAFYAAPAGACAQARVPAVVLVHGGGGTAFEAWARLWTSRGYAAIAMDLCGCVPVGTYGKWQRHDRGGPAGWGGFEQIDEPMTDQWSYHAIADVLLAHSLLRSFPEVDSDRIGITGISWGGYLTCIAAGVDSRFKCAVPVYGCGFLGNNSAWMTRFEKLGPERTGRWIGWWDPSRYLAKAAMPMLWVNGTNDFAYPMDSWRKSYQLAKGTETLCLKVRMPHGHNGPGENPPEIHAFMDSHLRGGAALVQISGQGREARQAWARWAGPAAVKKAELNFTRDTGPWQKRLWETVPARLEAKEKRVSAQLPDGVTVYYMNLTDDGGRVVSAEHEELPGR